MLEEWKDKSREFDEIRDNMFGWDVTDCSEVDLDKLDFTPITLRNGNTKLDKKSKSCAEKLLL